MNVYHTVLKPPLFDDAVFFLRKGFFVFLYDLRRQGYRPRRAGFVVKNGLLMVVSVVKNHTKTLHVLTVTPLPW